MSRILNLSTLFILYSNIGQIPHRDINTHVNNMSPAGMFILVSQSRFRPKEVHDSEKEEIFDWSETALLC